MMEVSHSMEEPDGNSVVKRLSVPIGLEELMTSLTKEVLKKKPIDIYNFASDHFTQLLSLRESGSYSEPTAKIITYINNVDFKSGTKSEKPLKDKQLARQVSLNVQPIVQNFKIIGKKSELKSDKRNKKEEVVKQKNEKLKLNKKKNLSKLDEEKNLNLQNDKNKLKESNGEVNKKSKKILDKTLPSKGKSTKIKKRVKSVDNFTSFSNFSVNHNIIDPEDIQINSLDKDNVSLSSENINAKNYNPSALRKELVKIQDESKFTSFTTTYNPYKLRQEIKSISLDETATTDELESEVPKDDVGSTNNDIVNINDCNKIENVEEKVCSINESDKEKDDDKAVILDKNLNFQEVSVIENLGANGEISTVDAVNEHNHNEGKIEENVKEVLSEEHNLNDPPNTSNEEKTYNVSEVFASAGLAAVKIQSMWRGFKTRKSFPVINNNNKDETSSKFSGLNNEMILNAATKIQAGVRGYLSRKQNKKVVNPINDEEQNNELKNKDELKEEIEENIQAVGLVTANLKSNANDGDNQSLNENENEIKILEANNKDLIEIEIINKESSDSLDQSIEPSSLQKVSESNTEVGIENEEKNRVSNETSASPSIDIQNIESEVKEKTSKIENSPKFEEITINENIIDEIIPAELNKTSQDECNLVNKAEDTEKLETTADENELKEGNNVNNIANSTEIIFQKIESDNNNTGSTELVETINDENFVNKENNNQGVREKRSINFQEIIEEENNKLIDSLNNSKNIAINKEPKIDEINQEIENKQLDLVMQPEAIDGIEDENNKEFQKDSKTEQDLTESNLSLGSILQHSGELHDTLTYFNEESKLSSDSISENVEKKDRKSLLNLEHSGELHDIVIIEKNNNPENKARQSEESSVEHKLQAADDRLNDKDIQEEKKNKNIIEDSKVENIEENYEIITKDTPALYDIEELVESDDKTSDNSEDNVIKDRNVVSELIEVNIDRKERDKESESEEKEKSGLDEKVESKISLQLNEGNIKSDTELIEMEKSKVPEDDLVQNLKLLDESVHGVDKETVETNKIIKTDDGTLEINETTLELSTADNKLKADESEEELTEKKITVVNIENIKNSEIENEKKKEVESETKQFDIMKLRAELNDANVASKENTDLVTTSENKESSETNKIEEEENVEHIEDKNEIKKFDITKLRAELEEAESINTKSTEIGTPTNEENSVEENKNVLEENAEIEKEITKIEVTKLDAGLDVREKIIKDISIDESTVDNGNSEENIEKEDNTIKQENIEAENEVKKFDITKLRSELEEAENINSKDAESGTPTNGKDSIDKIENGKQENYEIENSVEVSKENGNIDENGEAETAAKKFDITKLRAELDEVENINTTQTNVDTPENGKNAVEEIKSDKEVVEEIIKDIKIDNGSSEVNMAEKEENAKIEENVEILSETKQFDVTKLRAEIDEAENINTEITNLDTPTNEKDGAEVETEIVKTKVTKLDTGLAITEEITQDTIIDDSTEDTGRSAKENIVIKEENVEIPIVKNEFDITKLRAELEEVESMNTKSANPDTSINGKDIAEEPNDDMKESAKTKESTEVENEIVKSEPTQLDAGLAVTEEITKETTVDKSIEDTESSKKTEEEKGKIKENLKTASAENKLDEAENIKTEITNMATLTNEKVIVEETKVVEKENAKTEEVEKEIVKSEVTKLNAELAVTEEITKETTIDESIENTRSSKKTEEKEIVKIEEDVKAENGEDELDKAENVKTEITNLDTSPIEKVMVEETKVDEKENAKTEISEEVEKEIVKSEVTKLNAGLAVTEEITKEITMDGSIEDTGSSEKSEEKIGKMEENVKAENADNELNKTENMKSEITDLDIPTNGEVIVEEIKVDEKENANTENDTTIEKEIKKSEVTKLDTGLATTEEITKETTLDESIENTGSVKKIEEEEIGKSEENVKVENSENELDEAENKKTEITNLIAPINGEIIARETKVDEKENAKTEKGTEIEKEVEKSEVTKLDAGLVITEEITKDATIDESLKEDTESFEKTEEEKLDKIEENVKAENEIDETENKNLEIANLDTPTNGEVIDEETKANGKENAETKESTEIEKEIEKSEVTKLGAGLVVIEETTKDTTIDQSIENTESSEKTEETAKIQENVKVENELDKAENMKTEVTNLETVTNGKVFVEETKVDEKENAETKKSIEIEKEIEKSEVTKVEAGLSLTDDTGSSGKPIIEKEETEKIEDNVEGENISKKFDITKLRAELDEAENINTEITNLDTPKNEKVDVEETKVDKKEDVNTEESTEVEKEIEKSEVTKVGEGLPQTEEIIKETNIDESTEDIGSSEKKMIENEENIEILSEAKQAENINSEITKLDTSTNRKDIDENIKDNKEENGVNTESLEAEKEIEKTEATKLDTELAVTKQIIVGSNIDSAGNAEENTIVKEENVETLSETNREAENISVEGIKNCVKENAEIEESAEVGKNEINAPIKDFKSSEENITEEQETGKIEQNVEAEENAAKKFDITKLRSELEDAENINAKITNLDSPSKEKEIVEELKNGKEENVKIEEEIKNAKMTQLGAESTVSEETIKDLNTHVFSESNASFEKEEKSKIEENVEVPCETKTFDISKLRAELYEQASNTPTDGKDSADEINNNKEENVQIKEDAEVENNSNKFDLSKLRAELDDVQFLNPEDKNVVTLADSKDSLEEIKNPSLELNNDDKKEENPTVGELNEENSNKTDEKLEENTTTNKFDLSKLRAELYDVEGSKEDHNNLIENINKNNDVTTVVSNTEIEENGKANKFDLSKLRAELSEVNNGGKPTEEKELDKDEHNKDEQTNINVTNNTENESRSIKEINSTSQLHLIDKEDNNDAIKSNTTNDVDHQLTVINNDIEDVNKVIKNENTSQLEQLPTSHSLSKTEFECVLTESSDNLIVSPNDSNQSFSNKEVEPKINKEVIANTNQESNFNQTLLNNETNTTNRQDDMIDERAQSGISASPDSDVTVIFNTNSLNKLDDNLVNTSGDSSPTDKTELETEESVVNHVGENLENKNKSSFDISKLRMEIENSSKAATQENATQDQTDDSTSGSNGDIKSTDEKTKDTKDNTAATLIQSVYRGYQVRNKLKNKIKTTDESKQEAPYATDKFDLIQPKKEQDLKNEDFGVSDALGNVLSQQLAIAAPNAVDKSGDQPEYIHIPLKGSINESNLDQNRSLAQLQHSGEFHDIFPISNVSSDVRKIETHKDNIIKEDVEEANTNNSLDDDKKHDSGNDENLLKLHQAADGSVPQALEVVLNQQLAITTPCAKFEEKDKSEESDKVDYIHIPLKDPNDSDVNFESQDKVDVATDKQNNNGLNKEKSVESANINNEHIRSESANNNVLVNYSLKPDGSIQDESMPMMVQNTQISGSTMPVEVQPNQAPGAEILTSSTSVDETEASLIIENAEEIAQTSEKDASSKDEPTKNGAHLQTSMETSNRENTTLTEQNMENVAATKIQASFRGYQVRKQLKPKILKIGKSIVQLILLQHNGGVDSITLRRSLRRKSSGKLRGSENISKKQMDKSSDLEEKSATKIQAGIRGFLVRRRQTKAKNISQKSS